MADRVVGRIEQLTTTPDKRVGSAKPTEWLCPKCARQFIGPPTGTWCPYCHPQPDSLDAAWAEAEAALGDRFEGVRQSVFRGEVAMRWVASWSDESGVFNFYGPTPAAALHALTTEMRGHRP
jgi:hypothetical protein